MLRNGRASRAGMALTLLLAVLGFMATAASAWHRPTHAQQQAISRAVIRRLAVKDPQFDFAVKAQRISTRGPWASVFVRPVGRSASEINVTEGAVEKVHGAWRLARIGLGDGAPCSGIPKPVLLDLKLTGFCNPDGS